MTTRSSLDWYSLQRRFQERQRFAPLYLPFWVGGRIHRVQTLERQLTRFLPTTGLDHPKGHPKEPGTKRTSRVEGWPISAKSHEYVLQQVVDVASAGTEAQQCSEDVVELAIEDIQTAILWRW